MGGSMKNAVSILTSIFALFLSPGLVASPQNADPSKWMCRNLSDSGGFLYEGETIFGSRACRPIPQATPTQISVSAAPAAALVASAPAPTQPAPVPAPAFASPPAPTSPDAAAATVESVTADGRIPSGGVIAIAPMGGFDTYLAAAIREKKTPVVLTIDPNQSAYLLVSSEYEWQGWFAASSGSAHGSANWNGSGGTAN